MRITDKHMKTLVNDILDPRPDRRVQPMDPAGAGEKNSCHRWVRVLVSVRT